MLSSSLISAMGLGMIALLCISFQLSAKILEIPKELNLEEESLSLNIPIPLKAKLHEIIQEASWHLQKEAPKTPVGWTKIPLATKVLVTHL